MKEKRVFFQRGRQRKFLQLVIRKLGCPSLRSLLQFGFRTSYSSLKNYYVERRLMPKSLFEDFCHLAKIDSKKLKTKYKDWRWGQVKGGMKRVRNRDF